MNIEAFKACIAKATPKQWTIAGISGLVLVVGGAAMLPDRSQKVAINKVEDTFSGIVVMSEEELSQYVQNDPDEVIYDDADVIAHEYDDISSADDYTLTFETADVIEYDRDIMIDVADVERVSGWRVTAHGHILGALPLFPAEMSRSTGLHVTSGLTEVDAAAGFANTNGILAEWHADTIALQHPKQLISRSSGKVAAPAVRFDALMQSVQAGVPPQAAVGVTQDVDLDAINYAIYSISASGMLDIPADGVYEFRVVDERGPVNVHPTAQPTQAWREAQSQIAVEVAGTIAFGGAASNVESLPGHKIMNIVPVPVSLLTGSYPISFRAAPQINWNIGSKPRDFTVEFRQPGVHGWLNVAAIMTSPKITDELTFEAPIKQDVTIKRAGSYADRCNYAVLQDAFVNQVIAERTAGSAEPVPACMLTTIEMIIDAKTPGDYFVMPYIDSRHCMIAASYEDVATSTSSLIIPSPAASNVGYDGTFTSYSAAYGHIPVSRSGPVNVEIRAMCKVDANLTIFVKSRSSSRMLEW